MNRLALPLLLTLAACATPREQCLGSLPKDIAVLDDLIAESAGNIAREYAVDDTPRVTTALRTCFGEKGVHFCTGTQVTPQRKPVSIDLSAEQAKLASMQSARLAKKQELDVRRAQCEAQFPER